MMKTAEMETPLRRLIPLRTDFVGSKANGGAGLIHPNDYAALAMTARF
jgi:hypothetical protein